MHISINLASLLVAAWPVLARPSVDGFRPTARWGATPRVQGWDEKFQILATNSSRGNGTFEQYIDHSNPSLGTFSQWYMYSTEFWKGPGSPVILFTPGEANAAPYTSYLTNRRTTGVLAQHIGAAIINIEHRYWGYSSPFEELGTRNLQYLTLNNSLSDFTRFAREADLPFDLPGNRSNAADVPWVMMGGSYSGAISAWTASTQPDTFWAYHSSSAPVEAVDDYWQYFSPVQQHMPQNCSNDVSLVIDRIDEILLYGTADEKFDLKDQFGLGELEHDDDFAAAIENAPWLWQSNQFYATGGFYDWCDAVEGISGAKNVTNMTLPGANGVGLDKALTGYAKWFNETFLPGSCANYGYPEWEDSRSVGCFDTYNVSSPFYTDMSLANVIDRQWVWMTCNEPFGYWQDGAPSDRPSIVSRLVDAAYWRRQCPLFFPEEDGHTVGLVHGASEDTVNAYTRGWDTPPADQKRLLFVNGDADPWREAGVSSDYRPRGKLEGTEDVPVIIVPGGFHTSDLITLNGEVNAGAKQAIDKVVAQLKTWVEEWPGERQPDYGAPPSTQGSQSA